MRIQVKSAILHGPLFMEGSNLGEKISAAGAKACQIVFDTDTRCLVVSYKKCEAWISVDGGVASFIPFTTVVEPEPPTRQEPVPVVAQVEIPIQPKRGAKHAA